MKKRRSLLLAALLLVLPGAGLIAHRMRGRERQSLPVQEASVAPVFKLPILPKLQEVGDFFRRNETITQALARHGFTKEEVNNFVQATRSVFSLSRVMAGREFKLHFWSHSGAFNDFIYAVDSNRYLTVYRSGDRFIPLLKNFNFETKTEAISGTITDNLFSAIEDAGEQAQLAYSMDDIFKWDVDFNTDLRQGDAFQLLVEKKYLDGSFVRYGNVLMADLTVRNKRYSAFRYESQYYDPKGKALRKSFLKSPLKFTRITSRYTTARLHPILKVVRPHLGVDYAAPTGTPVSAVAAGRVVLAGYDGGFGNTVVIRHVGGVESRYSHLSHIDVHAGEQLDQGERIGEVGSTGLATGPHLDFRLTANGRPQNPTRMIFPAAEPVPAGQMARFSALCTDLRSRLDQLAGAQNAPAQAIQAATTSSKAQK